MIGDVSDEIGLAPVPGFGEQAAQLGSDRVDADLQTVRRFLETFTVQKGCQKSPLGGRQPVNLREEIAQTDRFSIRFANIDGDDRDIRPRKVTRGRRRTNQQG